MSQSTPETVERRVSPPSAALFGSAIEHNACRRKRCRWGLRVKWIGGKWMMTACRFNPDTAEAARAYGEKGVRDGRHIEGFEVVDRISPNVPTHRPGATPAGLDLADAQ